MARAANGQRFAVGVSWSPRQACSESQGCLDADMQGSRIDEPTPARSAAKSRQLDGRPEQSLPIIGRALGHKTALATMVYSRLSLDPIREAVNKATSAMLRAGGVKLLEGHSTPIVEGSENETEN